MISSCRYGEEFQYRNIDGLLGTRMRSAEDIFYILKKIYRRDFKRSV